MEQQLEFILRDMLDDLKLLKANLNDLQKTLSTIIDQINTFGKLLKEDKLSSFTLDTKPIEHALDNKLLHLKNLISAQSLNKRIEHKHHLHKGLFISLILTCICVILSCGWYKSYDSLKQFKANDIKYRALKLVANKSLLKLLNYTDSLYSLDSKSFTAKIDAAEMKK